MFSENLLLQQSFLQLLIQEVVFSRNLRAGATISNMYIFDSV